MNRREALMALNAVPNVGCASAHKLLAFFDNPKNIFENVDDLWHEIDFVTPKVKTSIQQFDVNNFVDEEQNQLKQLNARIITIEDNEYPKVLKELYDPPIVLYVMGKIPDEITMSFSVVGSRHSSFYGRATAEKISYQLGEMGFYIISGMARGIDTAAHRGCLKAKRETVAVLGCGLSTVYPPENRALRDRIVDCGAVISEFPCNRAPLAINFPRRNRIVSALSLGTVVIEAAQKSGALITANMALDQGKEVFAVPGNVDSPVSAGPLLLIKQGAKLVMNVQDILEEFPLQRFIENKNIEDDEIDLSDSERRVLSILNKQGQYVDQIAKICDTSETFLRNVLLKLEFKGFVRQEPGMLYRKVKDYG